MIKKIPTPNTDDGVIISGTETVEYLAISAVRNRAIVFKWRSQGGGPIWEVFVVHEPVQEPTPWMKPLIWMGLTAVSHRQIYAGDQIEAEDLITDYKLLNTTMPEGDKPLLRQMTELAELLTKVSALIAKRQSDPLEIRLELAP